MQRPKTPPQTRQTQTLTKRTAILGPMDPNHPTTTIFPAILNLNLIEPSRLLLNLKMSSKDWQKN